MGWPHLFLNNHPLKTRETAVSTVLAVKTQSPAFESWCPCEKPYVVDGSGEVERRVPGDQWAASLANEQAPILVRDFISKS